MDASGRPPCATPISAISALRGGLAVLVPLLPTSIMKPHMSRQPRAVRGEHVTLSLNPPHCAHRPQRDLLFAWLQERAHRQALRSPAIADVALVRQGLHNGHAPDLTAMKSRRSGAILSLLPTASPKPRTLGGHDRSFGAP